MEKLESFVFLALCATIPLLMIAVLVYRGVRWLVMRARWNTLLEERGWTPDGDESVIEAACEDVGLPVRRASLSWVARRDGALIALYRRRGPGKQSGMTRRLLLVPREVPGATGSLQPRIGGLLETAALAVTGLVGLGGDRAELEGWEWALVFTRGDDEAWLPDEASPRLRDFLHSNETLLLGERWTVLSLNEGDMPELLDRLEPLRDALYGESTPD